MKLKSILLLTIAVFLCSFTLPYHPSSMHFVQREFREYQRLYPRITDYNPEEVASIANCVQENTAKRLYVEKEMREINPQLIASLIEKLKSEPSALILMRHGAQQKSHRVISEDPALQKIAMMQLPDNLTDPMTVNSQIELLGTLVAFDYILKKTGLHLQIESSQNYRAFQVGFPFAILFQAPLKLNPIWDSINYSDTLSDNQLLEILPDGTLPWDSRTVDLVAGPGTYEKITREVHAATTCFTPQTLQLIATHTQQLNAVQQFNDLPVERLANFGIIALFPESPPLQYPNGLYF